jgi:predicted nucleic acid-binding protein
MSKLLIDANALIFICKNKPNANTLLDVVEEFDYVYYSNFSLFIARLRAYIDFEKEGERGVYLKRLKSLTQDFYPLPFEKAVFDYADKILNGSDWEDACQIATALLNKCDSFLTCDQEIKGLYGNLLDIRYVAKK